MEEVKKDDQENDGGKITKQYEANLKKVIAIVGGKDNIYPQKKVNKDSIEAVVEEVLKERKEEFIKTFKIDITSLLDKKVQLDKDIRAEEDKLKKFKENKQKEFNEACKKMFGKVESLETLERDYYTTLTTGTSNPDELHPSD